MGSAVGSYLRLEAHGGQWPVPSHCKTHASTPDDIDDDDGQNLGNGYHSALFRRGSEYAAGISAGVYDTILYRFVHNKTEGKPCSTSGSRQIVISTFPGCRRSCSCRRRSATS